MTASKLGMRTRLEVIGGKPNKRKRLRKLARAARRRSRS